MSDRWVFTNKLFFFSVAGNNIATLAAGGSVTKTSIFGRWLVKWK